MGRAGRKQSKKPSKSNPANHPDPVLSQQGSDPVDQSHPQSRSGSTLPESTSGASSETDLPPAEEQLLTKPLAKAPKIGSRAKKSRSSRSAIPGLDDLNQSQGRIEKGIESKATQRRATETALEQQPSNFIPEEVSTRMVRRVVLFCGIPTFLGLSSFGINYYLITRDIVVLPSYFTLVETGALFGLGFVGITYGVLSASWDSEPGSRLGLSEFRTNLGNMIHQWQEQAKAKRSPQDDD